MAEALESGAPRSAIARQPEIEAIYERYKHWDDPNYPYNGFRKSQRERDVRVLLRALRAGAEALAPSKEIDDTVEEILTARDRLAAENERLRAEALAPSEPPTKAWLLTEKRKDGRIVNEAIALTNDVAREWVQSPDMEFGQARSALPLKILPAPPRAEALAKLTNTI